MVLAKIHVFKKLRSLLHLIALCLLLPHISHGKFGEVCPPNRVTTAFTSVGNEAGRVLQMAHKPRRTEADLLLMWMMTG
jgi:hypothetical protein